LPRTTEQQQFALSVLQKQAELFLSTNMLAIGAVVGVYFHLLANREGRGARLCAVFAALGVPALTLAVNAYLSWSVVEELLRHARLTDSHRLARTLAKADFSGQLLLLGIASTWALIGVTACLKTSQPSPTNVRVRVKPQRHA
jgi:hypothetical protein